MEIDKMILSPGTLIKTLHAWSQYDVKEKSIGIIKECELPTNKQIYLVLINNGLYRMQFSNSNIEVLIEPSV